MNDCRLIDLPKIHDPRGNLTFIEGCSHVPFAIERVYYLFDVPGGSERGGHAHKAVHQLIIAMSDSFDVVLDDGRDQRRFHLGLLLRPLRLPDDVAGTGQHLLRVGVHGAGLQPLCGG